MTYRPSIEERIAWTPGLRPTEVKVLQTLARFGDHQTGASCYAAIKKLVAWSELSRATIVRMLRQLEGDDWIKGTHRHRHPTNYRICVERLATSPTRAKGLDRKGTMETRSKAQNEPQTTPFFEAHPEHFEAHPEHFEAQIEPPPRLSTPSFYLSAPALRAPGHPDVVIAVENTKDAHVATIGESPEVNSDARPATLRTGTTDVSADREDHPNAAAIGAGGSGGGYSAAPGAGIQLRQRPDFPSNERGEQPNGASVGPSPALPQQQTFGPMDVSASPPRPSNLERLADIMRSVLKPAATPTSANKARDDERKRNSG